MALCSDRHSPEVNLIVWRVCLYFNSVQRIFIESSAGKWFSVLLNIRGILKLFLKENYSKYSESKAGLHVSFLPITTCFFSILCLKSTPSSLISHHNV